jgi:hypothetical protein
MVKFWIGIVVPVQDLLPHGIAVISVFIAALPARASESFPLLPDPGLAP